VPNLRVTVPLVSRSYSKGSLYSHTFTAIFGPPLEPPLGSSVILLLILLLLLLLSLSSWS